MRTQATINETGEQATAAEGTEIKAPTAVDEFDLDIRFMEPIVARPPAGATGVPYSGPPCNPTGVTCASCTCSYSCYCRYQRPVQQ
jgi:hypothetical protein